MPAGPISRMLVDVIGARLALALIAVSLTACGGAGIPAALADPTPAPTPTPAPSAARTVVPLADPDALTFVVAAGSKAIVRVNEQLADRSLPSDAVLQTDRVTGEFTLLGDGTFAPSSKITVDLDGLRSDNDLRDGTVKRQVLDTRRFPQAILVPTKVDGTPLPLPASADMKLKLTGQLTVHGVTSDVAFNVVATRSGADLRATSIVDPPMKFGAFGMQQPRVFTVLSIKDEIRLEVQLVAKQKG